MPKNRNDNDPICRGCLSKKNLSRLFTTKNLSELFSSLTSIAISPTDQLPHVICKKCTTLLKSFDSFRKKCLKADEELRSRNSGHEQCNGLKLDPELDSDDDCLPQFVKEEFNEFQIDEEVKDELISPSVVYSTKFEIDNDLDVNSISVSTESKIKEPTFKHIGQSTKKFTSKIYEPNKMRALPYQCNKCKRRFLYEERLESHLREHDGKKGLTCELCNNDYTDVCGLQKHIQLMHKDDWNIRCTQCDKLFTSQSALTSHMTKHNGRTKPVCEQCGKSFYDMWLLKNHLIAHQTDRPFECDECGRKFKTDRHCRAHKFRHKGIRNFACDLCNKMFVTPSELRQHTVIHTGDKKFHCNICQKSFQYNSHKILHMESHSEITS